jgi:hypothetical protein
MTDESIGRQLSDAEVARAKAERYKLYQREVRSGRVNGDGGARPREFDESGFPIPQRNLSFVDRIARLLNPL